MVFTILAFALISLILIGPFTSPVDAQNNTIEGPVIAENFPDLSVIFVDGIAYAFATNTVRGGTVIHVQVATSTDNVTWSLLGEDALPNPAAWGTGGGVWAPDVVQLDNGTFVLYYCDYVVSSPKHHCVGAATSDTVSGPYTALPNTLACPISEGGAIDPDGFQEIGGKRYITYKVDGNSIGNGGTCNNGIAPIVPTPIRLQEVSAVDGVTLIGGPTTILNRDDSDGPLIEAPSLYRSHQGIYFLFYSSNCYTTPQYDIRYATATSIYGPYTKAVTNPLLVTGDDGPDLQGPGGADIAKRGELMVFHAKNLDGYYTDLVRGMYVARPRFLGTTVTL